MVTIGAPGQVSTPSVTLSLGGGQIGLTSFLSTSVAGQIAVASCGILPQDLSKVPEQASNQKCTVTISDGKNGSHVLFTGYMSGVSGRRGGNSFTAGVDLIHIARDLDNMRFGAPGLHPEGGNDFSYRRVPGASATVDDSGIFSGGVQYYSGGNIIAQPLQELAKRLTSLSSVTSGYGLKARTESLGPAIALLGSISVKGGDLSIGASVHPTINRSMKMKLEHSFSTQASLWDSLNSLFGEYGILLLCMPDGSVVATPDTAGIASPASNFIGGDQILSFSHNSQCYRNIAGVDIICSQASRTGGAGADAAKNSLIASYYPGGVSDGASFVLNAPGFLYDLTSMVAKSDASAGVPPTPGSLAAGSTMAAVGITTAEELARMQALYAFRQDYAKMIYTLERSKTRTFAVTTPLMPKVFPGTVCMLQPYSTVRVRPDVGGIGDGRIFYGYCMSVSHAIDFKGKTMSTTMQFRNVSPDYEVLNQEHPLYKCQPLPWE